MKPFIFQERARKRDAIRKFHESKEAERARLAVEADAKRIRAEREEKERVKEERLELRRKLKVSSRFCSLMQGQAKYYGTWV